MLNPVSILAVTFLSSLMSMAVLASLRPAGIAGLTRWISANGLAMISLVLFAWQGHGPAFLTIIVANGVMAAAVLLILQGARQCFGRRIHYPAEYGALIAAIAGVTYWYAAVPDIDARIAVVSAFHAYVYAALGWLAWRVRPAERPRYSYRFVAVVGALGSVGHLMRGATYLFGAIGQNALLQVSPVNIAFLGLGILALPCLSIGMVMLAHDRLVKRLERLANVDELTSVLSRRAFLAQAEALARATRRRGTRLFLAIIDLDHFKAINDDYGHGCGDCVLAHFAALVSEEIQSRDIFGRLGGEEFALCFSAATPDQALGLVDGLRRKVAASTCQTPAGTVACTFSVGVDEYLVDESVSAPMARADAALYTAKALGRNRAVAAWTVALKEDPPPLGDGREWRTLGGYDSSA
ncbi:MAG: GGDEF domain-containing protein [Burkholderiales bacterium]|nr:GGDEF domain-containing protein [Burkholderiales bacterium]